MDKAPVGGFAALVPEFDVVDLEKSLHFWCKMLGFEICFQRPENGFAYLERGKAQVMLCKRNGNWETASLERPFGRGINFQIFVDDIQPIIRELKAAKWPLFRDIEEAWYRFGDEEGGNRQFLVQDPDGYLVRFAQDLGRRPVRNSPQVT